MRVTIRTGGNATLLDLLAIQGIVFSAPCAGKIHCGKCRVRVLSGDVPVSEYDARFFNSAEIESGLRLACHAVPKTDCVVEIDASYITPAIKSSSCLSSDTVPPSDTRVTRVSIPAAGGDLLNVVWQTLGVSLAVSLPVLRRFGIAAERTRVSADGCSSLYVLHDSLSVMDVSLSPTAAAYGVAVDLGTTTIHTRLVNLLTGEIAGERVALNPQAARGADVLLRVQAAAEGRLEELSQLACDAIADCIARLCADSEISGESVRKIAVAGNTVMIHLLLACPCSSLGSFPFLSVTMGFLEYAFADVFKSDFCRCPVYVLPGISTFVGSDILAGLLVSSFDTRQAPAESAASPLRQIGEPSFFIDVGTNGEMALLCPDGIFCASAAAGPAFEGGRVSCGGGSAALLTAELKNGRLTAPCPISVECVRGLSGSALVDVLAIALEEGWVSPEGELSSDFPDGIPVSAESDAGGPSPVFYVTQKDIRELQLASAAIRAAVETLLVHAGIASSAVSRVFLAGAFGCSLNPEHAVRIGLLPSCFLGKIIPLGNSSLQGADLFLRNGGVRNRMETIRQRAVTTQLADMPEFSDFFIRYMSFPKSIQG